MNNILKIAVTGLLIGSLTYFFLMDLHEEDTVMRFVWFGAMVVVTAGGVFLLRLMHKHTPDAKQTEDKNPITKTKNTKVTKPKWKKR